MCPRFGWYSSGGRAGPLEVGVSPSWTPGGGGGGGGGPPSEHRHPPPPTLAPLGGRRRQRASPPRRPPGEAPGARINTSGKTKISISRTRERALAPVSLASGVAHIARGRVVRVRVGGSAN